MSQFTAKTVPLTTSAGGAASATIRFYGMLHAVAVRIGTSSTPDVDVTDQLTGTSILSVNGVAADTLYQPRVLVQDTDGADIAATYAPPAVLGALSIDVTGGGATKDLAVVLLFEH